MDQKGVLCLNCEYLWIPRLKHPKSCPRCKARVDRKQKYSRSVLERRIDIAARADEFNKYAGDDEYDSEFDN